MDLESKLRPRPLKKSNSYTKLTSKPDPGRTAAGNFFFASDGLLKSEPQTQRIPTTMMRLELLELRNIFDFDDASIDFSKSNSNGGIFVGVNASGKSNL